MNLDNLRWHVMIWDNLELHGKVLVRNFKLWVLDFNFCLGTTILLVVFMFFMRTNEFVTNSPNNMDASTYTLKTVGSIAPTVGLLKFFQNLCQISTAEDRKVPHY